MNVAGYEVTVTFDSTALGDVSIVNADYLPEGAFIVPAVVTETSAKLAATAIGAMAEGDGTLATVTFTVVEAKASAIGLDAIILDPTRLKSPRSSKAAQLRDLRLIHLPPSKIMMRAR